MLTLRKASNQARTLVPTSAVGANADASALTAEEEGKRSRT